MSRLIEVVTPRQAPDAGLHVPLWYRLSENSQEALKTAYKRATGYRRKLTPPDRPGWVSEFDAAREVSQAPESEEHMRRRKVDC